MSLGAYDEDEHERRAEMTAQIDAQFDEAREQFEGKVTYDSGESAEALLDQFKAIKED